MSRFQSVTHERAFEIANSVAEAVDGGESRTELRMVVGWFAENLQREIERRTRVTSKLETALKLINKTAAQAKSLAE